jgi:hypothetical protein
VAVSEVPLTQGAYSKLPCSPTNGGEGWRLEKPPGRPGEGVFAGDWKETELFNIHLEYHG